MSKIMSVKRATVGTAAALALAMVASLTAFTAQAAAPAQPTFAPQLRSFVSRAAQSLPSNAAVVVMDPTTGAILHSQNPDRLLMPASTMKLVTAAVALETFSPTQQFATKVYWDAATQSLYLAATGDPMLEHETLDALAAQVAPQLVGFNETKLFVDSSLFLDRSRAAGWPETYVPRQVMPVSALAIWGKRTTSPVTTAGRYFSGALAKLGMNSRYSGLGTATGVEIATQSGETLEVIVRRMLAYSDNNIAERLFRLSASTVGAQRTWQDAADFAKTALTRMGIDTTRLVLRDGSGLSRDNRLTARTLAQLLTLARSDAHPNLKLLLDNHLLAVAGQTGTLRTRFAEAKMKCARGQVDAKTGTLFDAVALAGYAKTRGGVVDFAVIVNGVNARKTYNVRRSIDWSVSGLTVCPVAAPVPAVTPSPSAS